METVEKYIVDMEGKVHFSGTNSIDQLIRKINNLETEMKILGYSENDIARGVHKAISIYTKDKDNQLKIETEFYKRRQKAREDAQRKEEERQRREDERRRNEEYRQFRQQQVHAQKLAGIANPFAFIDAKSGIRFQQLLNNVGRVNPNVQRFALAFQSFKGMWDFADKIAEINTKLLQLGYTSTLGAQKIADLGAAMAAFGGSAQTVAQGNERFVLQMEKMKRGGGLGYLGDVAYKYGFSVDMNGDWESNNAKAIAYARTLSKEARMAFLKEWDPANFTANMMKASMSAEQVSANDAFYKSYDTLGDKQLITEETLKYNIETEKAKRAWEAITNQLAAMLLPVMTMLTKLVTKFVDWLAKSPNILKVMSTILSGIAGFMALMIIRNGVLIAQAGIRLAKEAAITSAKIAGAVATGNWVGAAVATGMVAAAIGGVAAFSSGVGESGNAQKIESVDKEAVSLHDIVTNKERLTDREKYRFTYAEETIDAKRKADTEDSIAVISNTAVTLNDVFSDIVRSARKMNDALSDVAKDAMTMEQEMKLASVQSSVNNIMSNVENRTNNSNVNVNVNQTFNEAALADIKSGVYDMGSDVATLLTQAARRYNT